MNVSSGSDAANAAVKWLGTPYCWGGGHNGPVPIGTCVDCSGLVDQVFGVTGNTATQVKMGSEVTSLSSAQPGDLIFFGPLAPSEPYHVGIYTGMGMMIDAPHTGTTVRRDTVAGFGSISTIRRLVGSTNGSQGSTTPEGNNLFSYAQLEAIWIQAGGNAQYAPMAAAIAVAESSGDPNASNTNSDGSIDRGLWQINNKAHGDTQATFDVMGNARAAIQISNGGSNWRPWCTAYSDGACGSQGGCYQCPGSPYLTYFDSSIPPDYSAPINATNAAANLTSATLTSDTPGQWDCLLNPFVSCQGPGQQIGDAVKAVIIAILNPLVQAVSGVLGIGAGLAMMIWGIYMIIGSTQAGQQTIRGIGTGIQLAAPESRLAGRRVTGGERAAAIRQQTARETIGARQQAQTTAFSNQQRLARARNRQARIRATQGRRTTVRTERQGDTVTYTTTREVLRNQAGSYRRAS